MKVRSAACGTGPAAGPERIFALFTDRPVASTDVTHALQEIGARGDAAIRSTTRLPIAVDFQMSLLLEK